MSKQVGVLPWRVGSKVPRNLYDGAGQDIGRMDSAELAAMVVAAVNAPPRRVNRLAGARLVEIERMRDEALAGLLTVAAEEIWELVAELLPEAELAAILEGKAGAR